MSEDEKKLNQNSVSAVNQSQVKATKKPIRGEVPFTGTFGRRIYDYIFVPIIGADGEVEGVAGTTRDVTERKKAEAALLESQEVLRLAMSGSRMGAWSRNLVTEEVYWSPELEAIFGLPQGTFSGISTAFINTSTRKTKSPSRSKCGEPSPSAAATSSSFVIITPTEASGGWKDAGKPSICRVVSR